MSKLTVKNKVDHRTRLESPLARARGLGSAHEGSDVWLRERLSSLALIPLMLWFVWSAVHMPQLSYQDFVAWQGKPVNAILMLLTIVIGFYHTLLGVQVIIEDYTHAEGPKFLILTFLRLFFFAAAFACIFSVLKIAFKAP